MRTHQKEKIENLIENIEPEIAMVSFLSILVTGIVLKIAKIELTTGQDFLSMMLKSQWFWIGAFLYVLSMLLLQCIKAAVCNNPVKQLEILENVQFVMWFLFYIGFPIILVISGIKWGPKGTIMGGIVTFVIFLLVRVGLSVVKDSIEKYIPRRGPTCNHVCYGSGSDC